MRKRTRSREFALQVLYEIDLAHNGAAEALADFWEDRAEPGASSEETLQVESDKRDTDIRQYAERLVYGVVERMAGLDETIEKFAEHWNIGRMAFVDRNILRLASYEMLFIEEIPVKVAINEAVELAKRYGEADSSKFVNGILDKIAKTQCKKT